MAKSRLETLGRELAHVRGIASHLQSCKNIVVMMGAGVSVSAGIPDFRTPGTGLYDNLQKYGLPYPEAIFDLGFFFRDPMPFYTLCREIWPGRYQPTPAHHFVSLLHKKQILRRCYTQNIDSLESLAGLPKEKVVAAHGNFDTASCTTDGRQVSTEEMRQAVMNGEDACKSLEARYGGLVKPDIVFFGESLPARYFELAAEDFPVCDFLLVMGTSLQVQPFSGLIRQVHATVPRLLINRECVGEDDCSSEFLNMQRGTLSSGFQFGEPNMRDVFYQGDCDAGVRELASLLDWEADLNDLAQYKDSKL
mmetsp:Transcript_7071/g.19396  ORF Transcript_7071/g.19396 Transcript_7071/m.19396 type:complete len:307 (-) Transcript_7071:186-1106(-)|eukprot:CAMPEP_0194539714 /NCGR_PEP_ID=MMETSP0253-20130528/79734_1 /TAXON_ID=2966 /ORGANISM="Noctiluca scintillans" /LENGTH=306 /DNA_ID=CAMNT_0039386017 /DNA_START=101 /DNA_END=1021 /DNA_ORIENTATION=-